MRVLTFALSLGLIVAGAAGAQQKAKSEMVWEATIIGVSG